MCPWLQKVSKNSKSDLEDSHSYTYIEKSIRNGTLEDLKDHAVGPAAGTARSVGSITQPPKATRKQYTQEDERILWDWVNTNPQKHGGTDGNEIYKQLEAKYPQHPWQSWRDHWIKSMKGKAKPIYPPNKAPPTPPSETLPQSAIDQRDGAGDEVIGFSTDDERALMELGQQILDLPPENVGDAWAKWAGEADVRLSTILCSCADRLTALQLGNEHTAEQWQEFWERKIRPRFLRRKEKRVLKAAAEQHKLPKHSFRENNGNANVVSPQRGRVSVQVPHRSPSYRPESPNTRRRQPLNPQPTVQVVVAAKSAGEGSDPRSPLGHSILKRKRQPTEEVPSSSPPLTKSSPLPNRTLKRPKEIASTPDASPQRRDRSDKHEPLFLEPEFEAATDEILRDSQDDANSDLGQQPSESLSEPDRTLRENTQAFFREETPSIGLELAAPDGGWGSDEDAENADRSGSESQYDSAHEGPVLPDTQAILEGETQIPDFTIPEPEDWPTIHPPSSPPIIMPSSPAAESESSSTRQEQLDAEIETLIADRAAQRFTAEQVLLVLNSTCTDIQLAKQVLDQMGPQKRVSMKLPENVRGVWTERDDQDLYSSDARRVSRIDAKHGSDKFNARYQYLQLMAADE